ncbi:MAG: zinc ribbon domain-containing protein [Chloroflexi bacterium]|nr:zinc ribbon domain-containing protein [Chloroflexota bacterium]MBT3669274.1 zinc ribbon domain-containing protein [Chloroflexota bacterium]MBT4003099.1 zinc ribbon domain-containing protein [Chloroflexota bacterium]MBT4305981.1 zinc ribbon domain-containing protein [Chloroflexota bacterium]MBT4532625.1 zinc ribbon domain-containing protein [Chloroflexota bacterium]
MRKLLITAIFVVLLILPAGVFAQGLVMIDAIQVQFWPEYDRPNMLVLYDIFLSEDTPLPVELQISIPASSGTPNAVAVALEGRLVNAEYSMNQVGDWNEISVVADSTFVHIEYYDSGLEKNGSTRNFDYLWIGDHPVTTLEFKVQEPPTASNIKLSLPTGTPETTEGLTYYYSVLNDLGIGESASFSFSYDKNDDLLTVEDSIASQPQNEGQTPVIEQFDFRWLAAAVGVGLIGYGVYNSFQTNKPRRKKGKKRNIKRTRNSGGRTNAGAVFCHNCGEQGDKNDKFCRECGEKRRN